jgi:hypothetical protein
LIKTFSDTGDPKQAERTLEGQMLRPLYATFAGILTLAVSLPAAQPAGKAVNLASERAQDCRNAMQNIIKDYREGRDFSSGDSLRDQRLVALCNQAITAHDAAVVATSAVAGTKGIKPEMLRHVLESANRIVTQLNESARAANYAAADLRMMEKFKTAIAAVDCLASGSGCPQAQARRIIAQFNERGPDAAYVGGDEQAVRQFQEKRSRRK